jgi:hypothetical protein
MSKAPEPDLTPEEEVAWYDEVIAGRVTLIIVNGKGETAEATPEYVQEQRKAALAKTRRRAGWCIVMPPRPSRRCRYAAVAFVVGVVAAGALLLAGFAPLAVAGAIIGGAWLPYLLFGRAWDQGTPR